MDDELPPYEQYEYGITLEGSITQFNQQIPAVFKITNFTNFQGVGTIGSTKVTCTGSVSGNKFRMQTSFDGLIYEYFGTFDEKSREVKGEYGMKDSITDKDLFLFLQIYF